MKPRMMAIATVAALLVGCGAAMTQQEMDQYGSREYKAPIEKVFAAATAALAGDGYEIAMTNPEKGIIKTNRKFLRAQAAGATAMGIYRSYVLRLRQTDRGTTIVRAEPHVFQGDTDISDRPVWVMEGQAGERTLWARLFVAIDEAM